MSRDLRRPGPALGVTAVLLLPCILALGAAARLALYYRPPVEPLILGGLMTAVSLLAAATWYLVRRRRTGALIGMIALLGIGSGGVNGASYVRHRNLNLPRLPDGFEPAGTALPVVRPFRGVPPPERPGSHQDPEALTRWEGSAGDEPADAFYRHSLIFLDSLLDDDSQTRDGSLTRAAAVIGSWIRENSAYTTYPPSAFTWGDHSTALRLTRLLALRERTDPRAPSPLNRQWLDRSIVGHARRLAAPDFYTATNNHGLDQDIALLQAAWVMRGLAESGPWMDTALSRLRMTVALLVSEGGVMREHSPGYHLSTQRHLDATAGFLRAAGRGDDADWLDAVVGRMKRVTPWLVEPTGRLTPLGDTDGDASVTTHDLGETGPTGAPVSSTVADLLPVGVLALVDDGYVILRQKATHDAADSWHLVFAAASNTGRAHKHCDDLAVLLTGRRRLLTDPGRYRYSPTRERRFVVSCEAHSTLTMGTTQDTIRDFLVGDGSAALDGVWTPEGEGLMIATGRKLFTNGLEHRRTIAWVPDRGLFVIDRLGAGAQETVAPQVRFQLAPGVSAVIASEDPTRVDLEADGGRIEVWSHTPGATWRVERGADDPMGGWVSPARDTLAPAPALVLTTSVRRADVFLTEIRLGPHPVAAWSRSAGDSILVTLPGRRGRWDVSQPSSGPPSIRGPSPGP